MTDGISPRAAEALRAATGAPTRAEIASDRLAPLVRWLALRPDPADLVLACCEATGAEPVTVPHPGVVVIALPVCAATLPVSGWLELALAGARAVSVPAHPAVPALDRARALLSGAPRRPGFDALAIRAVARRRRWGRVWRAPVLGVEQLDLPRRGLIAPLSRTRRPGAYGRPVTERGRLLAALAALGLDPEAVAGAGRAVGDPDPAGPGRQGAPVSATTRLAASGAPATSSGPVTATMRVATKAGPATATARVPASAAPAASTVPAATPPAAASPAAPLEPIGTASPASVPDVLPAAELVADGCTACGVCARSCPEQALALAVDPDGGPARLHHTPLSCTDCGICVAICPAGALRRAGVLAPGDRPGTRELAVLPVTTCRRCRAAVAVAAVAGDGLCPVCADRRRNPFGSTLHTLGPAGAARGTG